MRLITDSEHFISTPGQFRKAALHKFRLYCIMLADTGCPVYSGHIMT